MWQLLEHKVLLRRSFLGIIILLFALNLAACSSVKTSENHPTISTIRVVMDENYPPYAFRDEQGNLQGILVDEWKLWEERTGVKVELYAFPWGEALEQMKAGEFDVIDTIFYNVDRAQIFDFTEPYAKIDVRIFFQNNISGIAKAEDLKGFRVAVKKGDANADYLQKHGITDLMYFDSYEQIVQAAKRKEVNIFVIDQPPALYFLYKYDIQQHFNYSGPLEGGAFHRAVKKGNKELLDLVVSGFSKISKTEYDTINARWFGTGYGQDLQQYMPYLGLAAALASLIILVLFIFNQTLQSRVQAKTVDLQAALDHLQESETRFREAIEFFPVPVSLADAQGQILSVNRKFFEEYGYSREDIPTMDEWMEHAYPDPKYRAYIRAKWDQDVADATQKGISTPLREYKVTCKDGRVCDVEIVMHPMGNMWVASFNNITERKQVADALRENRRFLADLIEYSGALIYVKDRDGRYELINRKWEEVTGLNRKEVIGNTDEALFPKGDGEQFRKNDLEVIETGHVLQKEEILEGEMPRYFISIKFPICDESGNIKGVCGLTTEITERKRAEAALRESEENYRNLVELSPDTIMVHSEGKIVFTNSAGLQLIHAKDASEVLGLPAIKFVHPEQRAKIAERIQEMQRLGQKVMPLEEKFICLDGAIIDVEVVAMPIHYEGKPGIQVVVRDITERKRSADIIQRNEKRFRTLIEHSAEALTLLATDGTVLYEGPTVMEITGYSPESRVGQNSLETIFSDDLPIVRDALARVLASPGTSVTAQFRSIRKDGSIWWTEGTATNLLDDPNVQAIVVNYRDVTVRKQAEEKLRESEHRYRTLFEQANDAIFVETQDDQILDANQRACQILGYTREELVKMRVSDLIAPEIQRKHPAIRHELSDYGGNPFESLDVRKDGSIIPVEVTNSILPNGLAISIVRDITERKQTEEALRKSEAEVRSLNIELEKRVAERTAQLEVTNRELEAFSYSVSHDLRAPLRAIDGFSRIVLEDYGVLLGADGQKLLNHVCLESLRMAQLIDALLNLSRMSRAELHKEVVDLSALAQQVVDGLRHSQPQRQVECSVAENVTGRGDIRLLNVVLENILGNAWKFTSKCEKAYIEFGTIQHDDELIYFVRDNGAGFDPAYIDKLFGAFQRLHRADEFEGTGIGLATVQRIITRHGGRVWAEAELEKGATFYFTLE
jgi:PAS domain S-box-containing protein